jgi:ketosteroid isomerase-like protein
MTGTAGTDTVLTTREIADRLAEATAAGGDQAAFDRLLADDLTWQLVGHGLDYARTYRGKAEVYGEYLGKLQPHIDHARSSISTQNTFVDEVQGAIVVVNHDALVLTNGAQVESDIVLVMRTAGGKIVSIQEFMDLRPLVENFGTSSFELRPAWAGSEAQV